jgi:hypothetical protein
LRVSFQLINLEERIKIFSNPKFKSREVIRYLEGEERPDANIN